MFPKKTVIFDLEYGEQSIAHAQYRFPSILEVGLYRVSADGAAAGKYSSLVQPLYWEDFTPRISALTGIEKEELQLAPTLQEVLTEVQQFCKRSLLASWGYADPSLLRAWINGVGYQWTFSNEFLDLQTYAQVLSTPTEFSPKLSKMCKHLHLTAPTHRALDDCLRAYDVIRHLQELADADLIDEEEEFQIFEF